MKEIALACMSAFLWLVPTGPSVRVTAQQAANTRPAIEPPAGWHSRYDLFQMTIEQSGLKVVDFNDVLQEPSEALIVALGAKSMARLSGSLGSFVRGGGKVLIGADSSAATPMASTANGPVTTPDSAHAVQDNRDCIRIDIDKSKSDPLLRGVGTVVVNSASYIYQLKRPYRPWTNSITWGREAEPRFRGKPLLSASYVETQSTPECRVVVCADPSLFSNGMLWHGDNAILAINIANALSGGRTKLYFMADGIPLGSYQGLLQDASAQAASEQSPELELEQTLRLANTVVANTQDSDLLNELLADRPRGIPRPYYHRGLLFGLAFAIVCLVLFLLFGRLPGFAPRAHLPAGDSPSSSAATAALASTPDLRRAEAARALAAAALTKIAGSEDPEKWLEIGTANDDRQIPPRLDQLAQLQRLIDHATAEPPRPIPLPELSDLDRLAARLSAELA